MKHGLITFLGDLIKGAATIDEFSTDGTLGDNSDSAIPTEKAVKTYADTKGDMSYSDSRSKVITFDRDLTTATGTVAITGIGFQPTSADILATTLTGGTDASWGYDDGTNHRCIFDDAARGNDITADINYSIIAMKTANPYYQTGKIQSFDSDGATFSFNKVGSPTGTIRIIVKFNR